MVAARFEIGEATIRDLIQEQLPQLADLPLRKVVPGGWDNLTFRLGDDLAVRLPSADRYAPQIAREAVAFAVLAGQLEVRIPERVHQGQPGAGYPFYWAINRWLPGRPAGQASVASDFAAQCGRFLGHLHRLDAPPVLPPGADNFMRGGPLAGYADEVTEGFARLGGDPLRSRLAECWEQALTSTHWGPQRWVHGDFFPWNLLVDEAGNLDAVIDWGLVAVGDPACDYALAWTCLEPGRRADLREASGVDCQTWDRARGWSLWKALTLATGLNQGTPEDVSGSRLVLESIALDCD